MLSINKLRKEFKSFKVDVENINLYPGEVVGLIGANGSGKTTLIKMLSGEMVADEKDVLFNNNKEYRHIMSYTPDSIRFKNMKVKEYIGLYEKLYSDFDFESVIKKMHIIGVNLESRLSTLSLGESQKLMMEIALNRESLLYIFDEPSDGYDSSSLRNLRDCIYDISNDNSLIIISTHQIKFYESLMDRVLYMRRGEVMFNISQVELATKGLQILKDHKVPTQEITNFIESPSFEHFLIAIEKGEFR